MRYFQYQPNQPKQPPREIGFFRERCWLTKNASIPLRILTGSGKHFSSMVIRRCFGLGLAALMLLAFTGACRQSETKAQQKSPIAEEKAQTVVRLHWIGQERLYADTNASYLTSILRLPEVVNLGDSILRKLSRAPWTIAAATNNVLATSNQASGLLHSLLRSIFVHESYFEGQLRTNQPLNMAFAIRLDSEAATLWRSNSVSILAELKGITMLESGADEQCWRLENNGRTNYLRISKAGDWTLVGIGEKVNFVVADFVSRIQREKQPYATSGSNYWLELDCDLAKVLAALTIPWKLPITAPRLYLVARGDGEYIKAQGEVNFSQPVPMDLESLNIPTNVIREPLVSFTALQGLRPWLKNLKWMQDLQITNVPNQFFAWAIDSTPVHTYAVTTLPDAAGFFHRFGPKLESEFNSWITNNAIGAVAFSKPHHGIDWVPVPMFTPTIQAIPELDSNLLLGRLAPTLPPPGNPPPAELLNRFVTQKNVVYYDWEITGTRLEQWIFLGQSARVAFKRAQLPAATDSFQFLRKVAPKLGNSITEVVQIAPVTFKWVRKSHLGFTALELHLLADWFESPSFPLGFHSDIPGEDLALHLNAKPRPPTPLSRTNAPGR